MKPSVIDLSIEGMTGIGGGVMATNCVDGNAFTSGTCNIGIAANSPCTQGIIPSNACNDGNFPSGDGTFCWDGATASGRGCRAGSVVSGYNPYCDSGTSGAIGDCNPNGSTANYCNVGNSNVGSFS